MSSSHYDVIVIGAGAAGLFAAATAGKRGRSVLVLDHAEVIGEKIRISGGGRCNFTNVNTTPANFLSENPDFCRSALARYTARDFIALVDKHHIAHHEKHLGQRFCNQSAQQIINLLKDECGTGGVTLWHPCPVERVERTGDHYALHTARGPLTCASLVVATGGLSIPKIGATDFGYRLAKQFGLRVVPPRPALVPLTFEGAQWQALAQISGLSLPVKARASKGKAASVSFSEDLLVTHRGLSGPAALQISSYWQPGEAVHIDLLAELKNAGEQWIAAKKTERRSIANLLASLMPARLAQALLLQHNSAIADKTLADLTDKQIRQLAQFLQPWTLTPNGTEGYKKAEVTAGGVDTRALSSQTMVAREVPGLYFIGEVMDVTGWLGGYNFQWAWSSGYACGMAA